MTIPPVSPAAAETECDLLSELFSPPRRADPYVVQRGLPLPGCQDLFVGGVVRDPLFAPAAPLSSDPAFQLLRRWMIRLARRAGS